MKAIDEDVVAMRRAHESGDVEAVRALMADRPELERLAPDSTWLQEAARAGHIGLIDFWLERGWDVNHNLCENRGTEGVTTALHYAKDAATTRHLLSRGAAVNVWARYVGTPLHVAVIAAVEVSQRGRRRTTPDSVADQLRALLEAGADPALTDFVGVTPLAFAVDLGRKTAADVLRAAGAPELGHRPAEWPAKAPRIDLKKDARRLATTLKAAIGRFGRQYPDLPVSGVLLAVSAVDGFVMIAFDTGTTENPWDASHSEYATLQFPHWHDAYELECVGGAGPGFPEGTSPRPTALGDAQFEEPFFDACVTVLEEAHCLGQFDALSRGPAFLVGVLGLSGDHERVWKPGRPGDASLPETQETD